MARQPDDIYYCTGEHHHQVIVPHTAKTPKRCPVAVCRADLDKGRKAR